MKLKKRILSVFLSIFLFVHTCSSAQLTAQANPALWGIYELILALAVSAGVSVSSHNISQGLSPQAEIELKNVLRKEMPDWLKLYTTGLEMTQNMVETGTLQAELEEMLVGETYDMDGIGIVKKADASYALSLGADIVKGVAEQIDAWAGSESNSYVTSSAPPLSTEYDVTLWSTGVAQFDSISCIDSDTLYSSEVAELFADNGWDDSNCWVYSLIPSNADTPFKYWTGYDLLDNSPIYFFVAIPFGYSVINNFHPGSLALNYRIWSTDALLRLPTYYSEYGYTSSQTYAEKNELHELSCVVYYPDLEQYEYYELDDAQCSFEYLFRCSSSNQRAFNYDDAFANKSGLYGTVNVGSGIAVVLGDVINGTYLSQTKDKALDISNPLSMDINEDTLPELEQTEGLTQYITYVTEQSIDLQELQDTIIEAEQNSATTITQGINAQTGALEKAIDDQTKSLLDGFTKGLSDIFVPDMTRWKEELDVRIDRVVQATAVLTLPLLVITPIFSLITESDDIPDFILSIPELEWMGCVLYAGYDFNVTQFTLKYDFLQNLLFMFRALGNIYITCCLANYGSKKFTTIVEGGK